MSTNDGNPNAMCPKCHQVRLGSIDPKKPNECINCKMDLTGVELDEYKPPAPAYGICAACGTLQGGGKDYKTCSKCGMTPADADKHVATLTKTAIADPESEPKRRRRA